MTKPSPARRPWLAWHLVHAFLWVLLSLALSLVAGRASAQGMSPSQLPEPLKAWVPWVMHGDADWQCPPEFNDATQRRCSWPGVLQLQVTARGARFSQRWHGVREDWVALPGEAKWWPQEVLLDGKPVPVLDREGVPSVRLPAGPHRLEGQWSWAQMPESLALPSSTALVQLDLAGKLVAEPVRDTDNRLWLGRPQAEAGASEEQAQVQVHRQWVDGVPVRLHTRVRLEVSGKGRELIIARSLLPGWVPQELISPLPATLTPEGHLRVQARAGVWDLNLIARHPGQVASLTLPPVTASPGAAPLVAEEEVWVFAAAPALRTVSLEGAPSVDPQQTTLPAQWRRLPAYLMRPDVTLNLKEQRRGDADPASDKLSLVRRAWLSFDGQSMTFHDRITGRVNQATRLEIGTPARLGRADVEGEDQMITLGSSGLTGLELRRGNLQMSADSIVTPVTRSTPAVGWRQDFDQVRMDLNVPAGWRLLHVGGVDRADGAWLSRWNLLDFFVVLIMTLTIGRLWGVRLGAVTFVMVVLSYQEPGFPLWIWLPLLVAVALGRVMPDSLAQVQGVTRWVERASLVVLVLLCLQFAISQARTALYPVLEQSGGALDESRSLSDVVPASMPSEQDLAMKRPMPAASPATSLEPNESQSLRSRSLMRDEGKLAQSQSQQLNRAYRNVDPTAIVQTGPGLPTWSWHSYGLQWDGPVLNDQVMTLWLLPPWVQKLLTVLRLALLGVLLAALVRHTWRSLPPAQSSSPGSGGPAALAGGLVLSLAGLAGIWSPPAQAKTPLPPAAPAPATLGNATAWPDAALLAQLKERLKAPPDCLPSCAELSRMTVQVSGTTLRLGLEVDADRDTAIPVPGGLTYWVPREVRANGRPEVLHRGDDGRLWLWVGPGRQRIDLVGDLSPASDTLQLPLPLKPRQVLVNAPGWEVEGLGGDEVADTFQLTRQRKVERVGAERDTPALPAYLRVERRVYLDLLWRVETTVQRESPRGVPALAQIPLLPGEAVTSNGINVKDGKVQVNLGPQADTLSWSSTLAPGAALRLSAAPTQDMTQTAWAETWSLDASTVWHVDLEGVPPAGSVIPQRQGDALRFYPWPGETLTLHINRPEAVQGQTLTVDRATWTVKPGARATDYELVVSLRSSRGLDHLLTLPEGAALQQVKINGEVRALRAQGRMLTLPVVPGKQAVSLSWRVDQGMSPRYQTQALALGLDSVNHQVNLTVPSNRWLLWVSGPGLGPAILFWGVLLVFSGAGLVLSRVGRARGVPLSTPQWLLLMVGLTQVTPWAGAIVVAWFFALARRGAALDGAVAATGGPAWRFNLGQLALVGATVLMLGVLCFAVAEGLLGQPDMQVVGNGSSGHFLSWTQDRVGEVLPTITLITLPLLVYRGLMLLWALWLAWSLLNWLRWGWGAWSRGRVWRSKKAPAPLVAQPGDETKP